MFHSEQKYRRAKARDHIMSRTTLIVILVGTIFSASPALATRGSVSFSALVRDSAKVTAPARIKLTDDERKALGEIGIACRKGTEAIMLQYPSDQTYSITQSDGTTSVATPEEYESQVILNCVNEKAIHEPRLKRLILKTTQTVPSGQ